MKQLRKYIRHLILENIKFAAFHGLGLNPEIMARDPRLDTCNIVWEGEEDNEGCPEFNGSGQVQPSEVETAVAYLNDLKPRTLMVYSRGASILGHALLSNELTHVPNHVIFVSAAWKRWGPIPLSAFNKIRKRTIYHGELDIKVPLAHSFELAQGSSVGILFKGDHYAGKDSFGKTHLGRDVVNTKSNWKQYRGIANKDNYINTIRPNMKITPRKGSPIKIAESGYWANSQRTIMATRNDGSLVVTSGQGSKTNWPGIDYTKLTKNLRDKGCDGNWVALSDDDRAKVPTFLGQGAGLGATKVILLDDVEDDETQAPATDPLESGPTETETEPEKTNWTPIALIAAGVIALPILLGGGK